MSLDETYLQEAEDRLAAVSPPLRDALRESLADLTAGLTDAQLRLFVDEGLELASRSLRSWEAGADYFRIAPGLLRQLDEAGFRQWAAGGRALAELAAAIAAAYFKASPDVLPALAGAQMGEWAHLGERLYKATWKSISLASTFFALSPVLLRRLTLSELGRLARVLEGISDRSADLAAACLDAAPGAVHNLTRAEVAAFLDFAAAISEGAWPEASLYFQRGPDLLRGRGAGRAGRYLQLATRLARRPGRPAHVLFAPAGPPPGGPPPLPAGAHRAVRDQGGQLRRLQGLRHPPDLPHRVRQLRLQLPPRRQGPAAPPSQGRARAARCPELVEGRPEPDQEAPLAHPHGALLRPLRRPPARRRPLHHRRGPAHRQLHQGRVRRHPPRRPARPGGGARPPPLRPRPPPASGLRREPAARQPGRRDHHRVAQGAGGAPRPGAADPRPPAPAARQRRGRRRGRPNPPRARRTRPQPAARGPARPRLGGSHRGAA